MDIPTKRIAVLIDAENLSVNYAKIIFDKVSSYGDVIVRRAYGFEGTFKKWKKAAFTHAVNFKLCPHQVKNKGVTDIAIVIDAMELMYRKTVDDICLATSDSDFNTLAMKLREEGIKVYGIGKSNTVQSFIKSCNEFHTLPDKDDQINNKETVEAVELHEQELRGMLLSACENLPSDNEGWINLASVGSYIKRISPQFNPPQKLLDLVKSMEEFFDIDKVPRQNAPDVAYIRKR